MITRLWRGWTTVDNADAHERFLLGEFRRCGRSLASRGADILRRFWSTTRPAFITLTRFDSVAAIQASPATITRPGPRTSSARAPRAMSGERFTSVRQLSPRDAPRLDTADDPR